MIINIELISKWLNSRKDVIKETLLRTYINDIDYKIIKVITNKKGKPSEEILISPNCFKKLCMMSRTEKADEVRDYFIKIEKLLNKYKNYIIDGLSKKVNVLENNQKPLPKINKKLIYFLKSPSSPDNVFKLGKSKKFRQRLLSHNSSHEDNMKIIFVYETDYYDEVESCLKGILKKYQYLPLKGKLA